MKKFSIIGLTLILSGCVGYHLTSPIAKDRPIATKIIYVKPKVLKSSISPINNKNVSDDEKKAGEYAIRPDADPSIIESLRKAAYPTH